MVGIRGGRCRKEDTEHAVAIQKLRNGRPANGECPSQSGERLGKSLLECVATCRLAAIRMDSQERSCVVALHITLDGLPCGDAERYGFKAVVKHVPDQAFALDEQLYRRLGRRFESALALWGAADDIHMVMIATFSLAAAGIPTIVELSLMPVTRQWLPIEDGFEKQFIERLVADGRSFVKGLRYNLGAGSTLASATLTDCEGSAPLLFVVHAGIEDNGR